MCDLAHGVVERGAEDFDAKVDGVASEVALRPAPVAFFNDEAGIAVDGVIARVSLVEFESAALEDRKDRRQSGGADLIASPAGCRVVQGGCHNPSSNGVGAAHG